MDFNIDMVWNYFISYDFFHLHFGFSPLPGDYLLGAEGEQAFQGVGQVQDVLGRNQKDNEPSTSC
jgi:hypothetical protein